MAWYEQSGLADFSLSTLTDEQIQPINELFARQSYDWFNCLTYTPNDLEHHWKKLDQREHSPSCFDMRMVTPPKLIHELIGFNGHLFGRHFDDHLSAYSSYLDIYGVKWPNGRGLTLKALTPRELTDNTFGHTNELALRTKKNIQIISVDFDTPWSQPKIEVFSALAAKYQCSISHYYCEQGMGFCGASQYDASGKLIAEHIGELQWSDINEEDACADIIGPDYIIEHLSSFGG